MYYCLATKVREKVFVHAVNSGFTFIMAGFVVKETVVLSFTMTTRRLRPTASFSNHETTSVLPVRLAPMKLLQPLARRVIAWI